jgi:carboxymethylenebutenolidase
MSCPDCSTGEFLPGEPTGTTSTQGAYFSPAPVAPEDPKRAVILLTDAFGLPVKNCKILADNLAKRLNCDVWVPDLFEGTCVLAGLVELFTRDSLAIKADLFYPLIIFVCLIALVFV